MLHLFYLNTVKCIIIIIIIIIIISISNLFSW